MKKSNILLLVAIAILIMSCTNKLTYKIIKINVTPDSLYSEEASRLVGKTLTTELYEKSLKLTIEGQDPLFLKLDSENPNYKETNNPIDYSMEYSGKYKNVHYGLHVLKDKDGDNSIELNLGKMNKNPTEQQYPGNSLDAALMNDSRNQVTIIITAKP